MKVGYDFEGDADLRKALNALPVGLQHAVYGAGFKRAGAKTKRVARTLCPPGTGTRVTRKGRIRMRLRDTILVRLVGWRWRGRKVPRSAVVVVAASPHAHLIEGGTKRWKKGPRPFLMPALKTGGLAAEFRKGCAKHFGVTVRQIRERKLTRATARALRLKETDYEV